MLGSLVMVTCLVIVAGRLKPRGVREPLMAAGGVVEMMQSQIDSTCTVIVIKDNTGFSSNIIKDQRSTWNQWQVLATFAVNSADRNNITDHLSKLIFLARQVRQLSWCSTVVVETHDSNFLIAFAEWSLKGRLLVWTTRLVMVTRLSLSQLQGLLPAHWTFSMMNTIFLNMEKTWYGVYTYLPYSPDGSRVIKIAIWIPAHGFKFLSPVSFFHDKYDNFYGAAVNVAAEPYIPYWGEEEVHAPDGSTTITYRGSDYRLVEAVASILNFTVRVLPTLSWDEVTSLVEERISLIAPIIHVLLTTRMERFDFTYTHENAHLSFGMAKPSLEPRWKSIYYPLATEVWIAVIAHVFFFTFFVSQFKSVNQHEYEGRHMGVGAVFQDMVGMLLGQNLPHRLSGTSSSRVLVAAWLVFALILGLAYRGNLTAALTLPKYPSRPETLKEIVNTVDMVTMPSYGKQHQKFYRQSESPLFQALGDLMNPGPSLMEGLRRAITRKSSHLDAKKYIQYKILDTFTEEDGSTRLYVSRESVFPSPCGWPIPHDAPYKAHLDKWIMTTLEAGLYNKWIADLMMETKLKSQRRRRQRQTAGPQRQAVEAKEIEDEGLPTLTISHTQSAFILLMLGLFFSILAFSGELLRNT